MAKSKFDELFMQKGVKQIDDFEGIDFVRLTFAKSEFIYLCLDIM